MPQRIDQFAARAKMQQRAAFLEYRRSKTDPAFVAFAAALA